MQYLKYFFCLLLVVKSFGVIAQNDLVVKKSNIIETIEGTTYYLHFVKNGETLYTIARAYDVTVNEIFDSNPSAQDGIKQNQILKIPLVEKDNFKIPSEDRQSGNKYFYHIVKQKETMYGLSRKYGVSIDELKNINPTLGEYLKEGQTIKIPRRNDHVISDIQDWEGTQITHTVTYGETLYRIAKKHNVSTGEIINANPGLTETLSIGQEIIIPNQQIEKETLQPGIAQNNSKKFTEHTVLSGETLFSIAKSYAISIDTLKQFNSGLSDNLSIGEIIRIPTDRTSEKFIIHNPDKKDKLNNIADKYDVSYEELVALNPGISRKVSKGQKVRIPVEKDIEEPESATMLETPEITEEVSISCFNSKTHKNKVYNVALMLPLFLEEVDSIQRQENPDMAELSNLVSFKFIQFYEGLMMAVDSMKNAGMKLNLFVYDVDNTEAKIQAVLESSELGSMDLIIGPFYSRGFQKVAAFAETYGINIVNPLSTREEIIYNNPYVFKIKPGQNHQIDQLASLLINKYPKQNIVLVRHNKYQYQAEVSYIRNYVNSRRKTSVYIPNNELIKNRLFDEDVDLYTENHIIRRENVLRSPDDSTYFNNMVKEIIYVNDSITGLENNLSLVRDNIVICIGHERVFSQELMSQLNKLLEDRKIILFGMPEWDRYNDLEIAQLLNLNFHSYTSSLVDFDDNQIKNWILDFRKKYNTEPSSKKYAFDGFDIGWYFLNALYLYGEHFENCIQHFEIDLLQTQFEFQQRSNDGYQNTFWNLGEFRDYKFIEVECNNIN